VPRRLLTALLVGVLALTMLPAIAVAVAGDVSLVPPDGQTAVKRGDPVRVEGSTSAEAAVEDVVLVALDADGDVVQRYEDGELTGLVSNDGGTLTGSFSLGCSLIPGCSADPAERDDDRRASVDAYRIELELRDGTSTSTITSPPLQFDERRPRITGYFLIAPDQIEVRFSEDVVDPQGDSRNDWEVNGDPTAVQSVSGVGDRRVLELRLGLSFGEDETPLVAYTPDPSFSIFPNTPYQDEAANPLTDSGRVGLAADRIAPDPPVISAIDGSPTSRDGNDQAVPVLGSDPTPTVTIGDMTDGHTARLWLDDGDGVLEDDVDTFIGEAVASGGEAEIAWPEGLALDDGTHRLFARALDGADCDPNNSGSATCPNASGRSKDALYDLDTIAPVLDDPALASTRAITVTFSEPVQGTSDPADWTVTGPDDEPGPAVTGVSGSGDSRLLQAEGVLEGSTLTYAPAGARLADAHGNQLADATVAIVAQPLPVVRLVDAEAEEQDGPSGPLDITYEENTVDLGVELSEPAREGETVSVTMEVVPVTATAGTDCDDAGVDYLDPGTVVRELSGEQTSATVPVQVCGDTLDEFDETFELRVTEGGVTNAVVGDGTAVGTILDDDEPVALSVDDATVLEGDVAEVTVRIDTASGKPVSAEWSLRAGTATPGEDYEDATGTLTIPVGETTTTVQVTTLPDDLFEGDEEFELVLDASTHATIADEAGTITITDDDAPPSLRISDLETFEGDEPRTERLVVTLSEVSGRDAVVDWATADGSATAGEDYTAAEGRLIIPAGATSGTIEFEILGDTEPEPDEQFTIELIDDDESPVDATIDKGTGTVTLLNDDGDRPLIIVTVTGGEVGEGDALLPLLFPAEVPWTVELSQATDGPIRIQYRTTNDGTATMGEDFEASIGTLEIPAGETTGEITADVIDDDLYEGDETVALVIDDPVGADLSNGQDTMTTMATIIDDDPMPTVAFADGSAEVEVTEGGTAEFTVELSAVSGLDTEVDWTTVFDGTADTDDLPAQGDTLVIPAGQASETFQVTTIDDDEANGDRTVTLELSGPVNAELGDPARSTLTILDDEAVVPTITVTGGEGNEDGGLLEPVTGTIPVPFTVELSRASDQDVTVRYRTTDGGTATAGEDFVADAGTLTIPAGETSETVEIEVIDDDLDEFDETVEFELSEPINGILAGSGPTLATMGTILDDDPLAIVSFGDDTSVDEGESVVVDVSLDTPSGKPITVAWATVDQSADGSDYEQADGTLEFDPGQTTATITIQTFDDAEVEGDEDFRIELSDPVNAALGDDEVVVTIIDNDEALPGQNVLSMTGATVVEGDPVGPFPPALQPGPGLDFALTLQEPADGDVEIDFRAEEGTATDGEDFAAAEGTVTIPSGSSEGTIEVVTYTDLLNEFDETVIVTITDVRGNAVLPTAGLERTGRILDDDPLPEVLFSTEEVVVNEGATAEFSVELSTPALLSDASGRDVSVDWEVVFDGTADTDDLDAQSGTVVVPEGASSATFEVTTNDDDEANGDRTATIRLSSPVHAELGDPSRSTLVIVDDDSTVPTMTVTGGEGNEDPGLLPPLTSPTPVPFTVELSRASDQDVTVRYRTTTAGTATPGEDFVAESGTLTIPAGDTSGVVEVEVIDDDLDEFDETVELELSEPANGRFIGDVETITAEGVILDDDPLVIASLGDDTSVDEGETVVVEVSLDVPSGKPVTVDWQTADGTATAGSDYEASSGTLAFDPDAGETSASIVIRTFDDPEVDGDKDFRVELTGAQHAELGDDELVVTIVDTDEDGGDPGTQPGDNVLSLSGDAVEEGDPLTPLGLPISRNELEFELRLSDPAEGDVVVDYETRAGTATADVDFESDSGQVTIPDGQTTAVVAVEVIPDLLDEFNETLQLVLTGVTGDAVLPGGQLARTGTIIDDDPPAGLRVSDATVLAGEVAEVDVTLDTASGKDITVDWSLVPGSAVAGEDYVGDSGTLTFPAGTTSRTVQVQTLEDDDDQFIQDFELVLAGAANAALDDPRGTISIVDVALGGDGDLAAIFLEDTSTEDGDRDHVIQVPVRLSNERSVATTASWTTQELTAADGEDYIGGSGEVTIPAGQTEAFISLEIVGDPERARNEDFLVMLTEADDGAIITGPISRVTIVAPGAGDDGDGGNGDGGDGDNGGTGDGTDGGTGDSDSGGVGSDGDLQGAPSGELPATGGGIGIGMVALAALLARRRRD
jgi:hypothetical protein